ncbi:hypothetical protein DL93DRAFT_276407 [Clavulina sp. PMI_390]|nr:hypothetical protein DL93DRAFT_276407 [Clavulina sp. PMI_390]
MPKLFVLDLESMSSSSVVPTLSMEPAEMTVLGDMDDDDGVQPKAFGQRWSLPSSDTPGAPRQDLLLSETLNYRTGDAGFLALTWSHSTRTLKCWPLVPHNVRNYEERLILPSGALLLDCSSSPILHNPAVAKEGEQSIKGSAFDFRIYRTNTNPTTLDLVSLVVPHPETITISYSNWATPYLCPVSGTIVILLRGGGDSDMFQVGVSRAVGLP